MSTVSLGAHRLRHATTSTIDEATVTDALVFIAHKRNSTLTELDAAKAEALAELRQGRSVAWALTVGRSHLPALRERRRSLPSPIGGNP